MTPPQAIATIAAIAEQRADTDELLVLTDALSALIPVFGDAGEWAFLAVAKRHSEAAREANEAQMEFRSMLTTEATPRA